MLGLDALLAIANIMYLLSYTMRDILLLRILTVLGGALLLPYYYLQPHALWGPIGWNVLFLVINIFWITRLLLERRPVRFTDEEQKLYESTFRNLSEREALKLFERGTWRSVPAKSVLLTQGSGVDQLTVIADGNVKVELDGDLVDALGDGRILGATAFLMRGTDFTAPVSVTTTEPTRLVQWATSDLDAMFAQDTTVEVAVESSLGLELSRFLKTARTQELHPKVS